MTPLLTTAEVASRLRCSRKTLEAHIRTGAIRYVIIGHGMKRQRRMFKDADVEEFIERQTRRNVPLEPVGRSNRRAASGHPGDETLGAIVEMLRAKKHKS